VSSSSVVVSTTHYVFAHGREPRGRGAWAFTFDYHRDELFWHRGTYTEAKRAAVAEARRRNASRVEVAT
jgi:hypothetical protein